MELRYRPAASLSLLFLAVSLPAQESALEIPACRKAHQALYEKPYSLSKEVWDSRCEDGLAAADILALGQEKCREQYNPKTSEPIGLSREVWEKDCNAGLSGQSPSDYFQAKQKQFVLESPIEKITAAQAYAFTFLAKNDVSPEVAAKRAELETRLAQANAAWGKLDASVRKERDFLALPLADTESRYRVLMERFDRASGAPAGAEHAAYAVAGGASGVGGALDTRPLRPKSPSMRSVDRGMDDPEAVRERLMEEVKSIAARRDEKGRPVYEPKVIKIMEMVVQSVPVRRGAPPETDLVALEDAKQTIGVISKDQPPVFFDSSLEDCYGMVTPIRRPDGSFVVGPDGNYKRKILLSPGSPKDKKEYSIERLAGVFIHEASHINVSLNGGGANKRVNENIAFLRENRYYSNKRQEFNQDIRNAQAGLKDFSSLSKDEVELRRKAVAERIKSRDAFLSQSQAYNLEAFEKDPEDFIYQIVPLYYGSGEDKEFKPGRVTLAQEKDEVLANKEALIEAKKTKKKVDEKRYKLSEKEVSKKLPKLERDEILDRESKNQDAAWRHAKRADCAAFIEQDDNAQALEKEMRALEDKLEGKVRKKKAVQIEKKLNQLREEHEKILDTRESCRVS